MSEQEKILVIDQDTRWKELIETLFDDFLVFFLPKDLVDQIDKNKNAVFLNQELHNIAGDYQKKGKVIQDQLVKVWLKNGREHWILIHIEVQASRETGFTKRMFTYFYRLFDKYKKPITAIAIYTGQQIPKKNNKYVYEFGGTKLTYKFNTYLVKNAKEKKLLKSNNPFALAILAAKYLNIAKKDGQKLYLFKLKLFELARAKGYTYSQIQGLIRFIFLLLKLPKKQQLNFEKIVLKTLNVDDMNTYPVNKEDQEAFERFAEVIYKATFGVSFKDILKEKQAEIARKEEEKQTEIARALLKKGDYSIKEIAEITGLSQYKVRKVKKQIQ